MFSYAPRPAKRARIDYSRSFKVLVGKEEKPFAVYTNMVILRSQFVRDALEQDFKNARETCIRFPDCEPATFNTYLNCVYDETFEVFADNEENFFRSHRAFLEEQEIRWVKLYILADHLRDLALCNQIADRLTSDELATNEDYTPSATAVSLVYKALPHGHKMRDLMVTSALMHGRTLFWRVRPDMGRQWPQEFLYDVAAEAIDNNFLKGGPATDFKKHRGSERKRGFWHQHADDEGERESNSYAAGLFGFGIEVDPEMEDEEE